SSAVPLLFAAAASAAGGDLCGGAPTIAPAPSVTDSGTTAGAAGDYSVAAVPSAGNDVAWKLTPGTTAEYHFELRAAWNASLYVVTDCGNPNGSLVASTNRMGRV